ncbi:MAG: MaoC family dehydratase N-terminal domain-containing protein [Halioglobus sp.]|nr:MaoC family dehydratase N-terminal domain-containing protein [Halioglobus sp.]
MLDANISLEQQLESLKGQRKGPYLGHNPVSATQIWQWCSAMGDNNPSYAPGNHQIAPPAMMQMWTMRDINDRYAPNSTDASPYQVFDEMGQRGYSSNVAVSYDITFHRYLQVGDSAQHYTRIVAISDKKTTALGVGFFVTECIEYLTLDGESFADALITYFQYQPSATDEKKADFDTKCHSRQMGAELSSATPPASGQTDYIDLEVSAVRIGDCLPEVVIPITHRLIVAGALATQDFIPVHHNACAAQAAGMPDIFMNILTSSGLCARYLGDWAGMSSRLKKLQFNLRAPNLPGDSMVMQGEVIAVATSSLPVLVTVAFTGENSVGMHISGNATLALAETK